MNVQSKHLDLRALLEVFTQLDRLLLDRLLLILEGVPLSNEAASCFLALGDHLHEELHERLHWDVRAAARGGRQHSLGVFEVGDAGAGQREDHHSFYEIVLDWLLVGGLYKGLDLECVGDVQSALEKAGQFLREEVAAREERLVDGVGGLREEGLLS